MLWSQNASPIRPQHLYLVVYINLMFGVLSSLPDLSDKSCTFKVTLRNFRVILSWELKNHSIVPDHYTLQYTVISIPDHMKTVEHCSNITATFCDLTDVWEVLSETYAVTVDGFRGNTTLVTCFIDFFLATHISLEPPEFDIVDFTDHINVHVNFPPVMPKILDGKVLQFYLPLIIEEQSGGIVKKHNPTLDENVTGNFTYVIDNLLPNTNYCVSVYFKHRNLEEIHRSPVKCTLLPPAQDTGSSESAKIGGIITMFLIAAVFISTILILKRVGYICLRNDFPKVLNFHNMSSWVFPEMPPLEAVAFVEVIHINRKKKVWNYSYDDESDSNDEAAAPLTNTALGMVPPPENVRMKSVNFKNILQWELPAFPKGNLTFTAQYQSYRKFQDMCTSTALTECDFSSLSKYGDHTLRVRAESADEHSDWVNVTFCPVDDTMIGPPGIQVEALANSLHMRFLAPKIENEPETWTMRNIYNSWVYNMQYWKNGSDEKWPMTCQYDFEVLRDLEPWTTYCVRVQGFLPDRNKTGEWSKPMCEPTADDETAPSWTVAVVLAASVCAAFLLLGCSALLWYLYQKTKHTFSPGNCLPQHLKEFLGRPHHSTLLLFSFPPSDENEVFDKLSVITQVSESSRQNPGDGCTPRAPSGQGSSELVPEEGAYSVGYSTPLLLSPTSEGHQSGKPPEQNPHLELSDSRTTSQQPKS